MWVRCPEFIFIFFKTFEWHGSLLQSSRTSLGQMALDVLRAAFTVILFQALYWVAHVVSKHSFLSYKYSVLSPDGVVGASLRVPCSQACAGQRGGNGRALHAFVAYIRPGACTCSHGR